MVVGFVVLLLSLGLFSAIAEDVSSNDPIVKFDAAVDNAIHTSTNPDLVQLMLLISVAGSELLIGAAVIIGLVLWQRRRWYDLLLLVIAVGGGELVNVLFKTSFIRLRPSFVDPVAVASGFSFPSGHAMASMVFYGLLAYWLMRANKSLARRVLIILIGLLIVSVIGFSRIYLGLHFPSDVLGGYSAGLAWLAFTISTTGAYRHWRRWRRNFRLKDLIPQPLLPQK